MAANTRHANRGGTTELGKREERSPTIEEINSEGKEETREEIEDMEWTSEALQHTAYEKKLIPKGNFSNILQHNVGQKKREFKMESTTIKAPGEGERNRVHFLSDGTKRKEAIVPEAGTERLEPTSHEGRERGEEFLTSAGRPGTATSQKEMKGG